MTRKPKTHKLRRWGKANHPCNFVGGPLAGQVVQTRTGSTMELDIKGGTYVPTKTTTGNTIQWHPH